MRRSRRPKVLGQKGWAKARLGAELWSFEVRSCAVERRPVSWEVRGLRIPPLPPNLSRTFSNLPPPPNLPPKTSPSPLLLGR